MFLENVESLKKYAGEFAKTLKPNQVVAFHGDLGAGKTEFARAVIQAIKGSDIIVPSPTFTIVQDYGNIIHFDLYRIKNIAELEEIGLFDSVGSKIVLIEWPEIADKFLPKDTINIYLKVSGMGREFSLSSRQ